MARQANVFRQLALAKALAEGMSEREIAKKFAEEWRVDRRAVRSMLKKLLRTWQDEPATRVYRSLSPWKTSEKARARMKVLREALASGEARGDVVRRYAELWKLSASWVDDLITRVLSEDQQELNEASQAERERYVAKIRAYLARYAELRDHQPTINAFDRLALLTKPGS